MHAGRVTGNESAITEFKPWPNERDEMSEYQFEVWQGDDLVASGSASTLEEVEREACHYDLQYGEDGPTEVKFYVRNELLEDQVENEKRISYLRASLTKANERVEELRGKLATCRNDALEEAAALLGECVVARHGHDKYGEVHMIRALKLTAPQADKGVVEDVFYTAIKEIAKQPYWNGNYGADAFQERYNHVIKLADDALANKGEK